MLELWSDLEQWASRDRHGELGVLRLDIAGSWLHVGLPVAQTILTESERQRLHEIFAEGPLNAEDPPPDAELARVIRAKGGGHLRPRTLNALAPGQVESDYSSVLLDRVLEELESWTEVSISSLPSDPGPLRGTLSFSLQLDGTAQRATFRLHVRLRGTAAETIAVEHNGAEYTCRLLADAYSTALLDGSHRYLDGAELDWNHPITLSGRDDLLLRAPASSVRVFTDGSSRGVGGFIETRLLDPTRPFAVASTGRATEHVRAWGQGSCAGFQERAVSGLPSGWALFTATRATSDASIREHLPQLSFARRFRRIRLEGGLRLPGATQYYFRFAPPVIRLEGASEGAEVRFNDAITVSRELGGSFGIPDDLLEGDTISVVCEDSGILRRRLIHLRDQLEGHEAQFCPSSYTPAGVRSEQTALDPCLACGVPESFPCVPPPAVPLVGLEPEDSAVLIGAEPGQIAAYQPGALPEWEPVWAVVRHRRAATARFVGRSVILPDLSIHNSRRAGREWKDVLWHQRKRIDPPSFEPARSLWIVYQKAARHA
jgi:hypothetical protein